MKIKINRHGRVQRVPALFLKEWKIKYNHGDYGRIAKALKCGRAVIVRAFKGEAQSNLITAINVYYAQKDS